MLAQLFGTICLKRSAHFDSSSSFKAALKTQLFSDYFYNRAVSDARGVAVGVGGNVIVKRPAPQLCAVDGLSGNIFNVWWQYCVADVFKCDNSTLIAGILKLLLVATV